MGVSSGPPAGFLAADPPLLLTAAPPRLLFPASAAAFLLSPSTYAVSDALTFAERLIAAEDAEAEEEDEAGLAMLAAELIAACALLAGGGDEARGEERRVDFIGAQCGRYSRTEHSAELDSSGHGAMTAVCGG